MADLFKIPKYAYKGIQRIEIPKTDDEFTANKSYGLEVIKKYLPLIMKKHDQNAKKVKFFYYYYLGFQDVLDKERLYNKDADNNNKVVENHAFRQVNFKVGFSTAEKRDYTQKSDSLGGKEQDDLTILDRYFTDCGFYPKDKDLKEWIYATGIGVTHTAPRTDIITFNPKTKLYEYANAGNGYDVDFEAPFTFNTINPCDNFVVYSSFYDKTPLFCVSIVEVDVPDKNGLTPQTRKEMLIETRYASFKIQSDLKFVTFYDWDKVDVTPKPVQYLPMIEYSINNARMGIVELNRDMFNAINSLKSSVADMIVDNANAILVFKNVDIDAEDVQKMKEAGAIIIGNPTAGPAVSAAAADLDTIKVEIPFEGLNTYYDQTLQQAYDIAGVPLASGQVTSGGDTGQARLLGGGWNNAYIIINNEITTLLRYDYEELKLILQLCRLVPNCKLDTLKASQIDIKYRINQNDNFLVKTQGIMNLYGVNMPLDEIVKASGLFSDVPTMSAKWQKRIDEVNEQAQKDKNTGNNSQE